MSTNMRPTILLTIASNPSDDIARASVCEAGPRDRFLSATSIPALAIWVATVVLLAFLSTAAWAQESCPTSPNYPSPESGSPTPDFDANGSCLAPNGDASLVLSGVNTVLQITTSTGNQVGSAWYQTPQTVTSGFTTTFQFQFTNPSTPPADGIAFLIQNSSTSAIGYTGGNGGALGYGDADSNRNPSQGQGIPSSVAIELDTYQNPWDPQPVSGIDSHVAIQSCGTGPNTSHHNYLCNGFSGPNSTLGQPVSTENSGINLADGNVHTVTIIYTPACSTCNPATVANIQVYVDSVNIFLSTYPNGVPIDLSTIASGTGTAYVGFTGATGGDWETQDILNWTFAPVEGAPINPSNPASLNQTFVISGTPGQNWSFNFDDTVSSQNGTITIQPGTTPFINSSEISGADWASIVNGTAMADTSCLLASATNTCAVNTMTCTNNNNNQNVGWNCPQSTVRNILFDQQIDVVQTQTNILNGILTIPNGYAFGLAILPDTVVSGGQCSYPAASGVANELCPQSILTQLEDNGPHGGGSATITNSSYLMFCCEPEWTTTPTIPLWNDTTSVPASFSSAPPPTPSPNTNDFQAAQGAFVVVGAEPHGTMLDTTYPLPAEETLTTLNGTPIPPCPALGASPDFWSNQSPQTFSVNGTITQYDNNGTASPLTEGPYDAHYFSVDCDSLEELVFPPTVNVAPGGTASSNLISFKTVQFNIDLTAPTVSYTLNPGSSVGYGSLLTAAITCTDPISNGVASGISSCAGQPTTPQSYPPLTTAPTVTVNVALPTNVLGSQSYAVPAAIDQAGNQGGATIIPYTVTAAAQTITFTISAPPNAADGTNFVVAASASSGLPVSYSSSGSCTNVGTTYVMTNSTGTCSVIANQAGNTDYAPAPTVMETVIATASLSVTFTPGGWDLGLVYAGTQPSQTFTISNTTSSSISITSIKIPNHNESGGDANDFSITANNCGKTLSVDSSCNVTVTFSAAAGDATNPNGNYGYVAVTDGAPGSPQSVYMYATVIDPKLSLPPVLGFGKHKAGTTSSAKRVKVTNPGTSPLNVSGLTISPSEYFQFAEGTTCTATTTLAPGGDCFLYITFSPSVAGPYSGSVTFTDNAQNSPQSLALSGTGD